MADKKKAEPKTQSLGITQDVADKLRLIKAIKGPKHVDDFIAKVVDREHTQLIAALTTRKPEPQA